MESEKSGPNRQGPLVSVLLVSYNSRRHLEACFDSLFQSSYTPLEVLMYDSASSDESVEYVRASFPRVRVIASGRNPGFARACNESIPHTRGKYVFLLNPDTTVDPRCIEILVREMEKDPRTGICGAKMLFGWEPELINNIGHHVNRVFWGWDRGGFEWDRGQYDEAAAVPSVCGGAALFRRSLFDELGYFDGRFFMYTEDVDYGLRANLAGYRVLAVPDARVYHFVNVKVGDLFHHQFYEQRNRFRTLLKNAPAELLLRMLWESLALDLSTIRRLISSGRGREAALRIRALLWNFFWLPDTLVKRVRVQRCRRILHERFESLLRPGAGYPLFGAPTPDYEFINDATLDRARLRPSFRVGENETDHLGLGWYPREYFGEKPVRWSGDYAFFYLAVSPGRAERHVFVEAVNPLGLDVGWFLNGEAAAEVHREGGGCLLGPVPRGAAVKVTLKIEKPGREARDPAGRPRGIALSGARVCGEGGREREDA